MQGTGVQSLVWEDPIGRRVTEPETSEENGAGSGLALEVECKYGPIS